MLQDAAILTRSGLLSQPETVGPGVLSEVGSRCPIATEEMCAQALSVDSLATEFLRLIDEGWQPDLDEFLARVPDDQREECKKRIEELCSLNGVDLGSVAA
ncbi:MAG: hypothetical protein ACYTGK_20510, partial [Planctomycetota bacterium]